MKRLITPRLIVRDYAPTDLNDFLAFHTHPKVTETMGKPPMSREEASRYLSSRLEARGDEKGRWQGFAVEHRADRKVVGEVGLYLHAEPDDEADLGFAFHPEYQGRGLATEAARALVSHAFEALRLHRVTGHCDAGNAASFRLLERLGMRRFSEANGDYGYAITRAEWSRS